MSMEKLLMLGSCKASEELFVEAKKEDSIQYLRIIVSSRIPSLKCMLTNVGL